ncbi:MAG TPA: hypothetical protein VLA34_14395, partial [Candidatus Krumholzibacterium sp.]|nr:hypothetical protein [Candidatus Krumholzibacterium sp.]
LCCRIDEMREGELEKRLGTLGTDIPGKDLLCFCDSPAGEQPAPAPSDAPEEEADVEEEEILELDPESEIQEPVEDDEMVEPVFIEKSEEIDSIRQEKKGGINIVRLVSIGVIVIVASFLIWWFLTERAIREQEGSDKMTELVAKQ